MTLLNKLAGGMRKLDSGIVRKLDYLLDIFQSLILISIIDEFCDVKLADKRDLMRSIITRKQIR